MADIDEYRYILRDIDRYWKITKQIQMKPEIKYFQNLVIDLHLFTPVVHLANFLMFSLIFFFLVHSLITFKWFCETRLLDFTIRLWATLSEGMCCLTLYVARPTLSNWTISRKVKSSTNLNLSLYSRHLALSLYCDRYSQIPKPVAHLHELPCRR